MASVPLPSGLRREMFPWCSSTSFFYDGKPQSGSGLFFCEGVLDLFEFLKYTFYIFRCNADALIANAQPHLAGVHELLNGNSDLTVWGRKLQSIGQQVVNDLAKHLGICGNRKVIRGKTKQHVDMGIRTEVLHFVYYIFHEFMDCKL